MSEVSTAEVPVKRGPGRPRNVPVQPLPQVEEEGRKEAPDKVAMIDEFYEDESKQIVALARAKLGDKAKGMSFAYLSARKDKELYEAQGYEFVFITDNDGNRKQLFHRGDPLAMIPTEKFKRRGEVAAAVATAQLQSTLEAQNREFTTTDRDGKSHGLHPA